MVNLRNDLAQETAENGAPAFGVEIFAVFSTSGQWEFAGRTGLEHAERGPSWRSRPLSRQPRFWLAKRLSVPMPDASASAVNRFTADFAASSTSAFFVSSEFFPLRGRLAMGFSLCQTTRMSRKKATQAAATRPAGSSNQPVSLKVLAEYLGLSPATISLVINRSPVAGSIPQETKDRIFSAARRFNYRPNFVARSLRKQRSLTIGVVVPEVSEGYAALVMSGIEDHLLQEGYFYFVASHRHRSDLINEYPKLLLGRSVEGIIAVDTPCDRTLPVPVVAVSGHPDAQGATNIGLNHKRAATLALEHLFQLGHRRVAFIKGQAFSSDTEVRWSAICEAASHLELTINPRLTDQLERLFFARVGLRRDAKAAGRARALHRALRLQRHFGHRG